MAKLTRMIHKIVIQLHLVVESYTICSSHSRWPVQKLLDTPSYNTYHFYKPCCTVAVAETKGHSSGASHVTLHNLHNC